MSQAQIDALCYLLWYRESSLARIVFQPSWTHNSSAPLRSSGNVCCLFWFVVEWQTVSSINETCLARVQTSRVRVASKECLDDERKAQ